ncbi:MAG: hypothetical protein DRJ42_13800 [Deltaproteobacteria bacterium]|nr:MAG: hypothetical protein DRJ42_13800 [Deltaproteobacteria bacterium]
MAATFSENQDFALVDALIKEVSSFRPSQSRWAAVSRALPCFLVPSRENDPRGPGHDTNAVLARRLDPIHRSSAPPQLTANPVPISERAR